MITNVWPFEFWRYTPIFLAAPAQIAFILIYSLRIFGAGEWWKSSIGRSIFIMASTITLLVTSAAMAIISRAVRAQYPYVAYNFFSYGSFYEGIVNLGYWLVCGSIYYQLYALVTQRIRSRKTRKSSS